jgi:hypothetical protein
LLLLPLLLLLGAAFGSGTLLLLPLLLLLGAAFGSGTLLLLPLLLLLGAAFGSGTLLLLPLLLLLLCSGSFEIRGIDRADVFSLCFSWTFDWPNLSGSANMNDPMQGTMCASRSRSAQTSGYSARIVFSSAS